MCMSLAAELQSWLQWLESALPCCSQERFRQLREHVLSKEGLNQSQRNAIALALRSTFTLWQVSMLTVSARCSLDARSAAETP